MREVVETDEVVMEDMDLRLKMLVSVYLRWGSLLNSGQDLWCGRTERTVGNLHM